MLKIIVVLKMLDLNRPEEPKEPEYFTSYVVERLRNLDINVIQVPSPIIMLETSSSDLIALEIASYVVDDLEYAISSINAYNPIVVFIREVSKQPNGKFKFRFQYIAQTEIKG